MQLHADENPQTHIRRVSCRDCGQGPAKCRLALLDMALRRPTLSICNDPRSRREWREQQKELRVSCPRSVLEPSDCIWPQNHSNRSTAFGNGGEHLQRRVDQAQATTPCRTP